MPTPSGNPEPEGFANFEEAAAVLSAREEESHRVLASPPRGQRLLYGRGRESSPSAGEASGSTSAGTEMAALKRQMAELQLQNQQLQATVRSQQTTIKQLQVMLCLFNAGGRSGGSVNTEHMERRSLQVWNIDSPVAGVPG